MSEARVRAPEIPGGLEWFNTESPLRLMDQRGKVVLLDFWSSCCINCMHVLPDLRYLENKYPDSLTVIGVHSPKFPNEREAAQLQKAINRYHIRHPVVNDPEFKLWQTYAIKAWPSIIAIDPAGYVLGVMQGEGRRGQLDKLIQQQLDQAEKQGYLARSRPDLKSNPEKSSSPLRFPGKIHATENLLYIADTGRNRIVETYHDGRVRRVFGSGTAGFMDGSGASAAFNDPQGMVKVGDYIYVADTGNHALRRIHLKTADVDTIAGTGEQGRYAGTFYDKPREAPLNSPWDLAYEDGCLYIAMAGQHQIWRMQLAQNTMAVFAGSGREDIIDGPMASAAFAQPSGLVLARNNLFVADSETSSVRVVRLKKETVHTLVGKGLFEFGDVDGGKEQARLQHPLAVSLDNTGKRLFVADTYNSKIKILEVYSRVISTFHIGYPLDEPGGLSAVGDQLFIANTNAHEVLCVDLNTRKVEALEIREEPSLV